MFKKDGSRKIKGKQEITSNVANNDNCRSRYSFKCVI